MRIAVLGETHLAQTLARAARLRGIEAQEHEYYNADGSDWPELVFAARDVLDHSDLLAAHACFEKGAEVANAIKCPLIVVSQVPPGTTRKWAAGSGFDNVFYQMDTIIMVNALQRASEPEQFIVGMAEFKPLPLAYQEYLLRHRVYEQPGQHGATCVSYETAELAKCMINYALSAQISMAQVGAAAAEKVGADWEHVASILKRDQRIGPHAYLRPGNLNQHLERDVDTIKDLARG